MDDSDGTLRTAEPLWRQLLGGSRSRRRKRRWPEDKQARIIVACMALHNFIRESRIADREFGACDADENYMPMPSSSDSDWPEDEPLVEDTNMNEFRDELAHALFYGV